MTGPSISQGWVLKQVYVGWNSRVVVYNTATGAQYDFIPYERHESDEWRLAEGWQSYV
ncbi:MAG TPA: hypothetical protein VD794_12960 [Flavisolibacter sp.]|nr:hypothetical protein [Flavisolibacter sp.]